MDNEKIDNILKRLWNYRLVRYVVYVAVLIIGVLFTSKDYLARKLMFHPTKGGSLKFAEDVTICSISNLHGYYVRCTGIIKSPKTLLYFHGNAGNASFRERPLKILRPYFNILIIEYSGYGRSKGEPSEEQLYKDGQNAYDFLRKTENPENIVIYGVSLGGGVATRIARDNECSGLILQSTFSGIDDFLPSILSFLAPWFPNRENLKHVRCPVLILHGHQDKVVPYRCSETLRQVKPDAEFFELQGGHNDTHYSDKMINTMKKFVYKKL